MGLKIHTLAEIMANSEEAIEYENSLYKGT